MKYLMLISFAFLLACNSDSNTADNHSDSTTHESHETMGNNAKGDNHMKDMHDAMNEMMTQMHNMQPTGDPDYDFAVMMMHHHKGAIEMAKTEVAGGSDAGLKQMAQKMIDDQQKENETLESFIQNKKPSGSSDFGKKSMNMMTPMENIKMEGQSIDAMFASMMVPHHQDAVKMSKEYLKVGKSEEIKKIANNIIDSQPKEIQELQQWMSNNKNG